MTEGSYAVDITADRQLIGAGIDVDFPAVERQLLHGLVECPHVWPDGIDAAAVGLAFAGIDDKHLLDLAIAVNVLILSGQLRQEDIEDSAFIGELSLSGELRPVRGIINLAEAAKASRIKRLFIPIKNFTQASLIKNINLIPV